MQAPCRGCSALRARPTHLLSERRAHYAELYAPDCTYAPRLWPAVDLTKPWLLFVEHPATAGGSNDFYVLLQGQGQSNPVEVKMAVAAMVQEASSSDAYTGYQPIPTGATDLVVRLSAASQDPSVSSAFYHCGIHTR